MNIESMREIMAFGSRPTTPWQTHRDFLYSEAGKPGIAFLKSRGLNKQTAQYFRLGFTESGEIAIPIFKNNDLIDYKFRSITEKRFRRHSGGETWITNEDAFQSSKEDGYIIIQEGEFDNMVTWQMGFKSSVSVTGGAQGPTTWIKEIPDNVKIIINFDSDEPGQEAAYKLAERIGIEKCHNMILPNCKDANDFILNGGTKEEFQKLLDNAEKFKVQGILKIQDVIDSLEKNKTRRVETFLPRLTHHLNGGVPRAGIITISGREKVGKSNLLMNLCINHALAGLPTLLVSLENDLYFTIQRLVEIMVGKPYKDFTKEDYKNLKSKIMDLPLYLDVSLGNWDIKRIEKVVEQMKKLYGIEIFGFDHLQYLSGSEVKDIEGVMRRLKMMSRNLDVITYLVSHVNRTESQDDYPTSYNLKGSSSIGQESNALLFMVATRNGHEISIDLSRMSRSKLRIPIKFDGSSGVISEDPERSVMFYDEVIPDEVFEKKAITLE